MKVRNLFIFIYITVCGINALASNQVEFSVSKVHSLLVFVEAIAGDRHRPPHLKKIFEESKFNNSESQKYLQSFRNLDPSFGRYFEFESLPKERRNSVVVRVVTTTQSAFSKDLKDFQQRILGLMPYDDITAFIDILTYFELIYDQLVWKQNHKALNQVIRNFKIKSVAWKLDNLFSKALKFYNSSWPKKQIFHISLYPIPRNAKSSNGQSFGAFESVGVIIGDKNLEGKFGVVFHELCHSLYDAQSIEFQSALAKLFVNHPSPYAKVAYYWFDEALATAVGNGWAYENAKGKMDKSEWYHHDKINGFAQGLYPKVVEYLNAEKSMDEDFVNFAIQTFEQKFPQSLGEYETILTNLVLLTDGTVPSSKELRRDLRMQFRIQSIKSGSPIDHERSKSDIQENEISTVFLIATHKNRKQLNGIEDVLPGLSAIIKNAPEEGEQFGIFEVAKRKVIILLVNDPSRVSNAIKWMGLTRQIEKLNKFFSIQNLTTNSGLEITLETGTELERNGQSLIEGFAKSYDLSKYYFTKKVHIQTYVTPHSHPVLTLNTRTIKEPNSYLAVFLHEQIHWFFDLNGREEKTKRFIEKMKVKFPKVPSQKEGGAKDDESTYLHLAVCFYELEQLSKLIGSSEAERVFKSDNIYFWVREQVLNNRDFIQKTLNETGLQWEDAENN